jgi:hypothetical protein
MTTISDIITKLIDFINNVLVPLVFALAFITFIWGVYKYLIAGASDKEKRQSGREVIVYSVIGFAVMMSIWGIVNLVRNSFGFDSNARPCLPTFGKDEDCSSVSGSNSGSSNSQPTNLLPNSYQTEPETNSPLPALH